MDYRYAGAFLEVAKKLNFTKAGQSLRISPAAIGRQIKLLEESVNCQLVIRSPQHVTLTKAGNELFQRLNHFHQWSHIRFTEEEKKEIRILVLPGLMENWLVNFMITHFSDQDWDYKIMKIHSNEIKDSLLEGKADLALGNVDINSEVISSLKLFREKIVMISKNKLEFSDLPKMRWILTCDHDFLLTYGRDTKTYSEVGKIYVESMQAAIRLVENGQGVAFLPGHLVEGNKRLKIKEVDHFSNEHIHLTCLNYKIIPDHVKKFIQAFHRH